MCDIAIHRLKTCFNFDEDFGENKHSLLAAGVERLRQLPFVVV